MVHADPTSLTVLLVEDDPGDQELTRRAFEGSRLGTRLVIVDDGDEALEYLRHQGRFADPQTSPDPHLVLLDLNLPRMNGKDVLREMRADPELRRIPVVVLTTSKLDEDILRTYDLGVNSFITKPVTMDAFIEAVHQLESYWFEVVRLPPQDA